MSNTLLVTQLPFNQLIGLGDANKESGFEVRLDDLPQYTNHLGTVHASAMLALAEAGSGAFLQHSFSHLTGFIPVVRRVDAKFRKPALGALAARCIATQTDVNHWSLALTNRGRLSLTLPVEVVDASTQVVMTAQIEWFITRPQAE
jgi:acyl-CoA thioesterase FadM